MTLTQIFNDEGHGSLEPDREIAGWTFTNARYRSVNGYTTDGEPYHSTSFEYDNKTPIFGEYKTNPIDTIDKIPIELSGGFVFIGQNMQTAVANFKKVFDELTPDKISALEKEIPQATEDQKALANKAIQVSQFLGSIKDSSPENKIASIHSFTHQNIVAKTEFEEKDQENDLKTPLQALVTGIGDCDDFAIANAGLAVAAGIPPENVKILCAEFEYTSRLFGTKAEMHAVCIIEHEGKVYLLDNNLANPVELTGTSVEAVGIDGIKYNIKIDPSLLIQMSKNGRIDVFPDSLEKQPLSKEQEVQIPPPSIQSPKLPGV